MRVGRRLRGSELHTSSTLTCSHHLHYLHYPTLYTLSTISTRTLHTYCQEAVSGQSRFRHSDLDGQASEKWRSKQCIGPSYSPYSHIKIDFRKYGSYMSSFIVNVRDKIMIPLRCEGARLINFSDIWPCPWLAEMCWVRQTVKGNIGHLRQIMASVYMKTSVTIKMMQWQQPHCSRCLADVLFNVHLRIDPGLTAVSTEGPVFGAGHNRHYDGMMSVRCYIGCLPSPG